MFVAVEMTLAFFPRVCRSNVLRLLYRKDISVCLVGILAYFGCALVAIVAGIPEPEVQDEFSYLLAADTFAHGRMTNPTHPMWMHFETMHVIHQPSYMSKYQPGQGMLLALGQALVGHPIFGVWLGVAFMSAAICWMLHAWMPARWAVLGGLLTIFHPSIGVASYWAQSYWGGALAASGGALLLGGARYLVRKPRPGYALATGFGLTILANTRPYEGFVLSIPIGISLLIWLLGKHRPTLKVTIRKILLPLGLVGLVSITSMGWYNFRVTANPLRLPYTVHEDSYGAFSYFIWQELPPAPVYRHKTIRDYHHEYEVSRYYEKQTLAGFVAVNGWILGVYWLLMLNAFVISLVGSARWFLPWLWRNRWGRLALLTYGFFSLGCMLETVMTFHYWSPITALAFFIIVQSIRIWRMHNYPVGQAAMYIVPLLSLAVSLIMFGETLASRDPFASHRLRAEFLRQLKAAPGKHLVVVKYGRNHSYHQEWVYNEADIDGAKIVWAHDMDLQANCALVRYFKEHVVWSLKIDRDEVPGKLRLFSRSSCQ
jgi:hypothetical protein